MPINTSDSPTSGIEFQNEIQDFGCLIGISVDNFRIQFFSENCNEILFDSHIIQLNQPLELYFDFKSEIEAVLQNEAGEYIRVEKTIQSIPYNVNLYWFKNLIYLEFEQKISSNDIILSYHTKAEKILYSKNKIENWNNLLNSVYILTGYDHVVIYKCKKNGGEIIAEKKKDEIESILGLQFNELELTDELKSIFIKKRSQIILDKNRSVSKIYSLDNQLIDLTYSEFRPISKENQHLLNDTFYTSRFCTVIVVNNEVWGFVAAFSQTKKLIPTTIRYQLLILTRVARLNHVNFISDEKLDFQLKFSKILIELKESLMIEDEIKIESSLLQKILKLSKANGVAYINGDSITIAGEAPLEQEILKIRDWALLNQSNDLFISDSFYKDYHKELELTALSAGLMFKFLDNDFQNFIIWFKKIKVQNQNLEHKISGLDPKTRDYNISKYSSFSKYETWLKNTNYKSEIWKENDLYVAKEIINVILESLRVKTFKIKDLYNQLKEINAELDSFSYTISHDLRTPLTVMKMNCQLLERSLRDNENQKERVKTIIDEIDRLAEMMHEILLLSKAKKSDLILKEINTKELISRIVEESKIYNNSAKTTVEFNQILPINADKTMAYEIFLNVINNAIKYSSKNDEPKVCINSESTKDFIIYTISDNGIGIKKEDRPKMFKLFSRMSNTEGFRGNGVGMSIVHRMMQRLDGEINFESEEGKGTTFILKFKKLSILSS